MKNNTANQGGGVYVDNTPVAFSGTVSLLNNHASTEGGGISFNSAAANQLLTNLVIAGNTAGTRGAGVVIGLNSFYIKKSTIVNNVSSYAAGVFVSLFGDVGGAVDTHAALTPIIGNPEPGMQALATVVETIKQ